MSYQRERDAFIGWSVQNGIEVGTAVLLLRYSSTLHRICEGQCNGDWPWDNGQRPTQQCVECGSSCSKHAMKRKPGQATRSGLSVVRVCPDCYATARVRVLLDGSTWQPYFQGDPRGCPLTLHPVGTSHEDMDCGRSRGRYVPSR